MKTILVVDADERVREAACKLLRAAGYNVLEADRSPHALRIARIVREPIELAVLDAGTARSVSGLAEHLAATHPGIRFLFVSRRPRRHLLESRILTRDDPYLRKPFRGSYLTDEIRRLLDGGRKTARG